MKKNEFDVISEKSAASILLPRRSLPGTLEYRRECVFNRLIFFVCLLAPPVLFHTTEDSPGEGVLFLLRVVIMVLLVFILSVALQGLNRTLKEKEDRLNHFRHSEDRLNRILDGSFSAVAFVDRWGCITYHNRQTSKYLGLGRNSGEVSLGDLLDRIHPEDREKVKGEYKRVTTTNQDGGMISFRFRSPDEEYHYLDLSIIKVPSAGTSESVVLAIRDITMLKKVEERVLFYQNYDPLTGLLNEIGFKERVCRELEKAMGRNQGIAVLVLGIDEYAKYQNLLEGSGCDEMIRQTGRRLEGLVRPDDAVGRLKGEIFAVLLSELRTPLDAAAVYGKIQNTFLEPLICTGRAKVVTLSAGITLFPGEWNTAEGMIAHSETTFRRIQESGGNRCGFYDKETDIRILKQIKLEEALGVALENRHFFLVYQPKVDAEGGIIGMEALIRWNHPGEGFIPPGVFIPVAEKSRLIISLGYFVISEVIRQLKSWIDDGFEPPPVAINVSTVQMSQPDFVRTVRGMFHESAIPMELIEFEVTERDIQYNEKSVLETMNQLKKERIQFSIDDFGTGYSSLSRMKNYPIDTIKIDKTFVQDLPHDNQSVGIVRSIIGMAHNLGYRVVAEGIETEPQFDFLKENGCDEYQGYWFHKPLSSQTITRSLKREKGFAKKL